ncbi:unnamed protein product, partial [Scytosiphon promiscuus]
VLEWTVGDCFDFAMVLCSLLLGAGYDAYVVYGTAPGWITVRDRARTPCPYLASTVPQKAGEEAHENGIGMPPTPVAGAKVGFNFPKSRLGEEGDPADAVAGSLPVASLAGDANSAGDGGGDGVGGGEGQAEGGGEEAGGDLSFSSASRCSDACCNSKRDARPYCVKPRGPPISTFLQEAARRAAEAKEAAKIDPWQSDGEEEEERDAAVEEAEDSLRGERVHAWVLVRGGKRGATGVSYVEPTTGAVYPTSKGPYLTVEGLFNAKNYW